jgi:hypothetical protein
MNYYRPIIVAIVLVSVGFFWSAIVSAQTEDPHKTGNVPIVFYGKVVDQSNHPVANVEVGLGILVGYLNSKQEFKQKVENTSLVTDGEGKFVLDNKNGSSIQFNSIVKDGYRLSLKQAKATYLYNPSVFHPDLNNPVIFKMWKKQGDEPLVGSVWHGQVACDGTVNRFDLLHGSKSAEGSLEIICNRTPLQIQRPGRHPFDYRFQISAIGGGIQRAEDEFTYLAPETGYEPILTIAQTANDSNWHGRVKQEFYIKTKEGHFGRLSVDWYASQTSPTHFEWDCSINPSGSRNLER